MKHKFILFIFSVFVSTIVGIKLYWALKKEWWIINDTQEILSDFRLKYVINRQAKEQLPYDISYQKNR